jgi:hypothetical protein
MLRPFISGPADIVVDAGELFIANAGNDSVAVFSRTASGYTAKPLRRIMGASTSLVGPHALGIDGPSGLVFVANSTTITSYPRGASGNVAPSSTLSGFASVGSMALDSVNKEIFLLNGASPSVTVYDEGANGVAVFKPGRQLFLPITDNSCCGFNVMTPKRLFVDPMHNELLVANAGYTGYDYGSVYVYPRVIGNASAPAYPYATAGALRTLYNTTYGDDAVFVDTVNDELFVAYDAQLGIGTQVFPRTWGVTVTGDTTASSTTLTNLSGTSGITGGMGIVGPGIPEDASVVGISGATVSLTQAATATATGVTLTFQAAPVSSRSFYSPGGGGPNTIFVDTANNELYFAEYVTQRIDVYPRGWLSISGLATSGSNVITSIASTTGILAGDAVLFPTAFPAGTTVVSVLPSSLTVSNNALSTTSNTFVTAHGGFPLRTLGGSISAPGNLGLAP